MLKNITGISLKYKLISIFIAFFAVSLTGVVVFSRVSAKSNPDIRIDVTPTLSLSPCFNNQVAPKTSIVSPTEGAKYMSSDKVSLTGIAVLECNNTKIDEKDLAWYLDSDTTPFAKGSTYSLENIKAGDHKIKLVAVSGKLKKEVVVNIKVEEPKAQVLGIKTQPPATVVVPVNKAPIVSIEGELTLKITLENLLELVDGVLEPATRYESFKGSATDPEDGVLSGKSLEWLDSTKNNSVVGNGDNLLRYLFTTKACGTSQYQISLKATDKNGLSSITTVNVTISHYNPANCLISGNDRTDILNL